MRRLIAAATGALHVAVLLASLLLTVHVAYRLSAEPLANSMYVWFAAAVIAHDLALFPVYALADRVLVAAAGRTWRRKEPAVPAINHVRVPALASGLLLLLFFPGIIQQGADTYLAATGQDQSPFLARWLTVTACLFTVSAIVYLARLGRARSRVAVPGSRGDRDSSAKGPTP